MTEKQISRLEKHYKKKTYKEIAYAAEFFGYDVAVNRDEDIMVEYILNKQRGKHRYIDFNQGLDAREICKDKQKMKLLSKLAIKPARIAFDHLNEKSKYVQAVREAEKCGIKRKNRVAGDDSYDSIDQLPKIDYF